MASIQPLPAVRAVLCALAVSCLTMAAARAQDTPESIERREAAAGFVQPQAMALGLLRRECRNLMPSDDGPDAVAQAWWERNQAHLDASLWVIGQALARYRSEGNATQAQAKERAMLQAFSGAMMATLRPRFARQFPTAQACATALAPYRRPELDIHNVAQTMNAPRFQEFAQTLAEVTRDVRYRAPDEARRRFDAQVPVMSVSMLTHDAIEAAKARDDAATVVQGYERLTSEGDATAAQTLGLMHLTGQGVPKSAPNAAAWFYNAWALGEPEGVNALGVMWRDGLTGAPDPAMALVAFAAAQRSAKASPAAHQRALNNLMRLMSSAASPVVEQAACTRIDALRERAHELAAKGSGVTLVSAFAPAGSVPDRPMEGMVARLACTD